MSAMALTPSEADRACSQQDACGLCEESVAEVRGPTTRSASDAARDSKLRYTNSLDSATQWRRDLKKRTASRHAKSAMVMVSLSMGFLVLGSIVGIRVLSWDIISRDLTKTSEDGQKSKVEQVSKEVLSFFQLGSRMAQSTSQFYNISFAQDGAAAPQQFLAAFGKTQWSALRQSVTIQDVLVAQARNLTLVAASADASCNVDSIYLGDGYLADISPATTGLTQQEADDSTNPWASTGVNLGITAASLAGDPNIPPSVYLADPLMWIANFLEDQACSIGGSSIANGEYMWADNGLPGTWGGGAADSGLRGPRWQRKALVSPAEKLVRKAVFFGLPGPSWAPRSAWGRVTIRVEDETQLFGEANLQSVLRSVAADSRGSTVIFILTGQGELLASSLESQKIVDELAGSLFRGDEAGAVMTPIQPVAEVFIQRHCSAGDDGELDCDWGQVEVLQYIGSYAVVAKPIDDPLAAGLGLLLVDLVDVEAITGRIEEINLTLIWIGLAIMLGAVLQFVMLSRQVTVPLRKARDNMFLLSDMKIDDAISAYAEGGGCCSRPLFTEARDLRLSFLHAAGALRSWRAREVQRRMLLEKERAQRIQHTVERAVQGAGRLMHPMVLVSAEEFMQMQELTSYERLRNEGKLEFLDTEEDLARFKAGHSVIFLSHQWLSWGFPDDHQQTQLKAMKSAVRTAAHQMRAAGARGAWKNMYVWVDYCSIAQEHRGMQTLAVSSLPVYASSADVFIIVAPPAKHAQSNDHADLHSYNSRGWCRAEMLSKICSSGLENFFVLSTEGGELQRVTEEWLPSLSMYVFEGEFSCCQQRHAHSACDKEALVEPVLGLYSLVLRQVSDAQGSSGARHMEQVLRHIRQSKERFFPKKYTYRMAPQEGETEQEQERELFGPLVEALEQHMDAERSLLRSDSLDSARSVRSRVLWVC
ncbi:unnamed protein product [Prorocentrum cordatum]|uniref:CHASE domain-containing protein n=1 Tax=Prorocentrum cordatum TaxID=2364126 RepID=A0ABN9VX82_9DINO|nr:unnamed protein product [Polarella glacialis]